MTSLETLQRQFKPRRMYADGVIRIEVDGAFIRVDDDGLEIEGDHVLVALEDVLQDPAVIRSARVSTGRDTAAVTEKAVGMIQALYRDAHVTPFEGSLLYRLRVESPIHAAQPFFLLPYAHNEFSGRYSVIDGAFYTPSQVAESRKFGGVFREAEEDSQRVYRTLLDLGVAKEQARFALLYRFFTKFYWTVSLRHLLMLMALETNEAMPVEFREAITETIPAIVHDWTPWVFEAFRMTGRTYPTAWAQEIRSSCITGDEVFNGRIGSIHVLQSAIREDVIRAAVSRSAFPIRGFGHSAITFSIRCPIFVYRQLVRHRQGVWSELPIDFDAIARGGLLYVPEVFRTQQGKSMAYHFTDGDDAFNAHARNLLRGLISRSVERYGRLRGAGMDMASASLIMPYSFQVPLIWTTNLDSLMNFFSLRCDTHAQQEIRVFADAIWKMCARKYPWVCAMFLQHFNFGKSELFGNADPKP